MARYEKKPGLAGQKRGRPPGPPKAGGRVQLPEDLSEFIEAHRARQNIKHENKAVEDFIRQLISQNFERSEYLSRFVETAIIFASSVNIVNSTFSRHFDGEFERFRQMDATFEAQRADLTREQIIEYMDWSKENLKRFNADRARAEKVFLDLKECLDAISSHKKLHKMDAFKRVASSVFGDGVDSVLDGLSERFAENKASSQSKPGNTPSDTKPSAT